MENKKNWDAYTNEAGEKCIGFVSKNQITIAPNVRYEVELNTGKVLRLGENQATGNKSKLLAILLALFLGGLGVHKFYLGENKNGFIYLLFCWTYIPALFGLFEAISMIGMSTEKFNEKFNQ